MRFKLSRRATPTPHRNMELDTNHSECYCRDQNLVSPQPRVLIPFSSAGGTRWKRYGPLKGGAWLVGEGHSWEASERDTLPGSSHTFLAGTVFDSPPPPCTLCHTIPAGIAGAIQNQKPEQASSEKNNKTTVKKSVSSQAGQKA